MVSLFWLVIYVINKKINLQFLVCCCRYFFKMASDEFDCGVVNEEVTDDDDILPTWEGKIVCRLEKAE